MASTEREILFDVYDAANHQLRTSGSGGGGSGTSTSTAQTMQSAATSTGDGTSLDVSTYVGVGLAVTGITSATIVVEGQDANNNWQTLRVKPISTNTIATSITADGLYEVNVSEFRTIRARISVYSSGTITAKAFASSAPNKAGVQITGLSDRLDSVNDSVTAYAFGNSYATITSATTTTVKSGSGVLDKLIVNGGTTGTIKVYDNTAGSGTLIADFDTTNTLAVFNFQAAFTTGLTIVTSAATKLTVIYR